MFCIAAFIVLIFMSAVSAKYRGYLKKAWGCTFRRVTLRPCDTSFKDEAKSRILAPIAVKHPTWVKPASIAVEIASFLIIVLTVWSLLIVIKSGLNLYVYGTCNPSNAASCSLGAEACSIDSAQISLVDAVTQLKMGTWITNQYKSFADPIAAIPTRIQKWDATKYQPQNATYLKPFDPSKPASLEVIDPGCIVCQNLYRNIEKVDFAGRYNLTYIAYPIPNPEGGHRFPHSQLVVQYLEAIRLNPLNDSSEMAVDWKVLDRIFTGTDEKGLNYQAKINTIMSHEQVVAMLDGWLKEFGYNDKQIADIKADASSQKVADIMSQNASVVRDEIKTVKIPTIIFNERRHDGLVDSQDLK